MNPIPLIIVCGYFCFCLTGPVAWPFTVFGGVVFGWTAGLYYAAWRIDHEDGR